MTGQPVSGGVLMEESKRILQYDLQFFAKDGPGGEKTEEFKKIYTLEDKG